MMMWPTLGIVMRIYDLIEKNAAPGLTTTSKVVKPTVDVYLCTSRGGWFIAVGAESWSVLFWITANSNRKPNQ